MFSAAQLSRFARVAATATAVTMVTALMATPPSSAAPAAPTSTPTVIEAQRTSVPSDDPTVQRILAEDPEAQYLGEPVRVSQPSPPAVGRLDGRDVVYQVFKGTSNSENPGTFTAFDLRTGELLVEIPMPSVDTARAVAVASDGKVYAATYFDQRLWQFDPVTKQLRDLGTYEPVNTDAQPFGLCAGPNGTMFIPTYKSSGLYRYDPATDAITRIATVNPENTYLHACAWDPRTNDVYVSAGGHDAEIWRLADGGTGAATRITDETNTPGLEAETFVMRMELVGDHLFARTKNSRLLVIGTDGVVDHWNATPLVGGYHVVPSAGDPAKVLFTSSSSVLEYDITTATIRDTGQDVSFYFGDATWDGADLIGVDATGIFRLTAAGEYSVKPMTYSLPTAVQKLLAGPNGMMFASGYPTGLAQVDTTGGGTLHPSLSSGQYESAIVRGSLMYVGHYGNARFSSYDPNNPTRAPRLIFDGLAQGQDRPFAMAYNPDLDEVYLGTIAGYGKVQGGLALYRFPSKLQRWYTDTIVKDQSIISVVYNRHDKLVYIGTNVDGGMGVEQPAGVEAKLVVWDPATRTVVRTITPVADREGVTGLMVAPDGRIWGWAEDTLFVYDPATGEVVERHSGLASRYQPATTYWAWAYQYVSPVDGNVYATVGGQLLRIDPATRAVTVLVSSGANFGMVDSAGDVYFSTKSHVFRYVVPQPIPDRAPRTEDKCLAVRSLQSGRSLVVAEGYRQQWSAIYQRIADRVDAGEGNALEETYCS